MGFFFADTFEELQKSIESSKEREQTLKEQEQILRKYFEHKKKFEKLIQEYNQVQSSENWDKLQKHVNFLEIFIKKNLSNQEYLHIQTRLANAKKIQKPLFGSGPIKHEL